MTNHASAVLQTALTEQSQARTRREAVYLNTRGRTRARVGRWISEDGFYTELPFSYAVLDPSNAFPDEGEDGRAIDRIFLVPYGVTRDLRRLQSTEARDRLVHTSRAVGAPGLAPFPGNELFLGPADLGDDGAVAEKNSALLAGIRTAGSGVAYHAVVTRAGAVIICAPLDERVAPVPGAETAVCVALEGAVRRERAEGSSEVLAPLTEPQRASLAVLIAKIGSAYFNIDLTLGAGLRVVFREEENDAAALPSLFAEGTDDARLLPALISAENAYDVATSIFRREPPTVSGRAEAQTVIGHTDTVGTTSLLLGAYANLAALERSESMEGLSRRRMFVRRAQAVHQEAADSAEAASAAASAPQLTPVLPTVEGSEPHAYNYLTGLWGDEHA